MMKDSLERERWNWVGMIGRMDSSANTYSRKMFVGDDLAKFCMDRGSVACSSPSVLTTYLRRCCGLGLTFARR